MSDEEISTIWVSDCDIGRVPHYVMVDQEPLNLSHGVVMALDSIRIVNFN